MRYLPIFDRIGRGLQEPTHAAVSEQNRVTVTHSTLGSVKRDVRRT